MSEWWTYRLTSFLLFSPQTYRRLFELYNAALWPAQLATIALGVAIIVLLQRPTGARSRLALAILALLWALVGWMFHYRRYATINWAAEYFAAGFALEAVLLAIVAMSAWRARTPSPPTVSRGGRVLSWIAVVYPVCALLFGRPLVQAEVFGLAPDPTAIGTLGALLAMQGVRRRWLACVPLLWCVVTALTLWSMDAPDAAIPAAAALVAVALLSIDRRQPSGATR